MKRALITGQNGSYLAEYLLEKVYEMNSIKSRASLCNTQRIDHIYEDSHALNPRLKQHYCDQTNASNLYEPGDYFHPENSYVLPALIGRFRKAAQKGGTWS